MAIWAGQRGERLLAWGLLLPCLAVVCAFAFWPIVYSMVMSLHRIVLGLPGLGAPFVGLDNYARLLSEPAARSSALTTLVFVGCSTLAEVTLGTLMALALDKSFRGRGLVRAAVLVPWAIPTVVASQMWRFILNDRYGLLNWLLFGSDVASYQAWLASPGWALGAVIMADVWKTSAFAALIVLAGLQVIPRELREAAALDGAGPWQRFRFLTLPLVLPALAVALVFRTMDAFRVFDLVYVMTQGGPANATNVLQYYGYKKMFAEGFMGYGSAVSVMVFFIVLAVSLIYLRLVGRRLLRGEAS